MSFTVHQDQTPDFRGTPVLSPVEDSPFPLNNDIRDDIVHLDEPPVSEVICHPMKMRDILLLTVEKAKEIVKQLASCKCCNHRLPIERKAEA